MWSKLHFINLKNFLYYIYNITYIITINITKNYYKYCTLLWLDYLNKVYLTMRGYKDLFKKNKISQSI